MQAVILIAGYGSRLNRDDVPHKCLLPFGNDTLLSRHLFTLQQAGIEKTVLVVKPSTDTDRISHPWLFYSESRYA